jgi:tetratricopeptide (TPR) repeat protein
VLLGVPVLAQSKQAPAAGKQSANALQRASEAFKAGLAAQQAGKPEEARVHFTEAVRLAPMIAEAHEALGAVLVELKKTDAGIKELELALKLKPEVEGVHQNLALAYMQAGNYKASLPHFAAVSAQEQQSGETREDASFYEQYGRALEADGQTKAAIHELEIAKSIVDSHPDLGPRADLADEIGLLYAKSGDLASAMSDFEAALRLDDSYFPALIHKGVTLRLQNQPQAALEPLMKAEKLAPESPLVELELGRTYVALRDDDSALPLLQKAVDARAKLPNAENELAMVLQRLGRHEEAIPYLKSTVEADPKNVGALSNLGLSLTEIGKAKEAIPYFEKALEIDPKNVTALEDLGVANVQLSEFDAAIVQFQKALDISPNDSQLHYDLGLVYKFKDRNEDAIVELHKAAELDPELPDPPYTLGILLMQIGRLDEAAVQLKKASELRPGNGDVWAVYGSVLKQLSRLEDAIPALNKAIELLPTQPGPRLTLAGIHAQQAQQLTEKMQSESDSGKAEELRKEIEGLHALAAAERKAAADLTRAATNRQKSNFAMNAGNQLMQRNAIADAVARYQEAIADDNSNAEAHTRLAIAYERQGRSKEAEEERAKAAQLTQEQK